MASPHHAPSTLPALCFEHTTPQSSVLPTAVCLASAQHPTLSAYLPAPGRCAAPPPSLLSPPPRCYSPSDLDVAALCCHLELNRLQHSSNLGTKHCRHTLTQTRAWRRRQQQQWWWCHSHKQHPVESGAVRQAKTSTIRALRIKC